MSARAAVIEVMQTIAAEFADAGHLDLAALEAVTLFAQHGAAPDIVAVFFTEARRKTVEPTMIAAAGIMLEHALGELRVSANGGDPRAPRALQVTVDAVLRQLARGRLSSAGMTLLVRCFTKAQLPLPEALCQSMDQAAADSTRDGPPMSDADLLGNLAGMAEMLRHDPFAIYGEMALTAAAIPPEQRAAMAGVMAGAAEPSLRAAALGFAFAPEPRATAWALAAIAARGSVAPTDPVGRWLRLARPWFAADRLRAIDDAIEALGVAAPAAMPAAPAGVLATITDGAGATSVFATFKSGRKHRLTGTLLKRDAGVFDTWLKDDMTKAESESLVRRIQESIDARPISTALAGRILANALAVNLARDVPPPFDTLRIAELFGLDTLVPAAPSTQNLIAELLEGLPAARTGADAVARAHVSSADWINRIGTMDSWFEAGPEVHARLRPLRSQQRRFDYIMTTLLPARRGIWARNCAWAALVLRDEAMGAPGRHDETWIDLALVARDLAGERALVEIPLALQIATATVRAFAGG